jgi:hypothetical protein
VDITINMNRVCQKVQCWRVIVTGAAQLEQAFPIVLRDMVVCLAAINRSKVEGSVKEDILVSEVDPLAQSQKMTTRYEGGRCVGRANEMGMSSVKRSWKVLGLVILEPI